MRLLLIGAGGNARAVAEVAGASGHEIFAYADPKPSTWCRAMHVKEDDRLPADIEGFVIGVGGVTPEQLHRRLQLLATYRAAGLAAPAIRHLSCHVSGDAGLGEAAIVLGNAIVQPGAQIGDGAIVNSGAIVEHDATIGEGAHVAPGAIVLGAASVGACSMIGAGAVVLPGANVPEGQLVKSLTRFSGGDTR